MWYIKFSFEGLVGCCFLEYLSQGNHHHIPENNTSNINNVNYKPDQGRLSSDKAPNWQRKIVHGQKRRGKQKREMRLIHRLFEFKRRIFVARH